MSGETPP